MTIRGSAISLTSHKKKQQDTSEREIQGTLINFNKQCIFNPSDSLKKDMDKSEMELKILREKKGKWYYNKDKGKMASRRGKSTRYFCNLEKRHYLEKKLFKSNFG